MTTVGDVMSRNLLTMEQEATLVEAAAAMTARRGGAALIVSGGRLIGILTERDVMRACASGDVGGQVVHCVRQARPDGGGPDDAGATWIGTDQRRHQGREPVPPDRVDDEEQAGDEDEQAPRD